MKGASEDDLIAHCRAVAGDHAAGRFLFAAGCRRHSRYRRISGAVSPRSSRSWRSRSRRSTAIALSTWFNGVVAARAEDRVALYTGNDDNIVLDLVTPFVLRRDGAAVTVRIKGGLLGHWSVWTKGAVELFGHFARAVERGAIGGDILALAANVTDCNAAFFDVANDFRGCIAGCHEVLRRQGLFRRHLVSRPGGGLKPRAGGGDRSRDAALPRTRRR